MPTRFHKQLIGLVLALLSLSAGLRIYQLGSWSFAGDEIFTLRDSLDAVWLSGPKPLLFVLNYHLVGSWRELNELGLRILPALFGIAAVPAVYWLGRRTINQTVGLIGALILALHPWHVFYSQYARYYTLVFLLCAIYPVSLYIGVKEKKPRWA